MLLQTTVALLLAALFLMAGITKLLDLRGTRAALTDFGVPSSLIPPLAYVLPTGEVFAVALLWPATYRFAAAVILFLSTSFLAAISYQLSKGRNPQCHCFGQLYSRPLSRSTLLRSALIFGSALWLFLAETPSASPSAQVWRALAGLSSRDLSWMVLIAVCLMCGVQLLFSIEVLKQNGRLLKMIERSPGMPMPTARKAKQPAIGSKAPEFALPSLGGEMLSLSNLRQGKPLLLMFSDPGCGPCQRLMPLVAEWQRDNAELIRVVVISRGTALENSSKTIEVPHVLLQKDREVMQEYGCEGTPAAVLIDEAGFIGGQMAHGAAAIRELMQKFAAASSQPAPEAATARP